MPRRAVRRLLPGLLGAGLLASLPPADAAPPPTNAAPQTNAPGRITPRVARRVAAQDRPVPDAALQAPGEEREPSVRRAPAAPAGVRIRPRVTRDEYRAAYHAVPFSLAEHRANPGYRHAAAMKFLTGDYPPPTVRSPAPIPGGLGGVGGLPFGQSPARGFPGLVLPGGFSGPPTVGPPPFAFDRVRGVVPTFVNRYQTPRVFLPRR